MSEDQSIDIQRYLKRHARKEAKRRRKARLWQRCEVVVCGDKGPHKCGSRAMDTQDGHNICAVHRWRIPEYAVFTNEEAMALHRNRRKRQGHRPWIGGANGDH